MISKSGNRGWEVLSWTQSRAREWREHCSEQPQRVKTWSLLLQLGFRAELWCIKEGGRCKVSHLFHLCSRALPWSRETLVVKNAFLMKHNFRLSMAVDFYLFLSNCFQLCYQDHNLCFPRWNFFSFLSYLVLKINRTDRQASPEKTYPRKAACKAAKQQGSTTWEQAGIFWSRAWVLPSGGIHVQLVSAAL